MGGIAVLLYFLCFNRRHRKVALANEPAFFKLKIDSTQVRKLYEIEAINSQRIVESNAQERVVHEMPAREDVHELSAREVGHEMPAREEVAIEMRACDNGRE